MLVYRAKAALGYLVEGRVGSMCRTWVALVRCCVFFVFFLASPHSTLHICSLDLQSCKGIKFTELLPKNWGNYLLHVLLVDLAW